jgi:hypothetical protein
VYKIICRKFLTKLRDPRTGKACQILVDDFPKISDQNLQSLLREVTAKVFTKIVKVLMLKMPN